ncbi:unnamed protein product [Hymenolepis diminuta]|uniref:Uncharacterized protein n=1 Tax=Hymenolepis diminuta TaxID=6216 RepID=A0A564YHA8_HYMDI|nr:unnamed protein product [Hymenolepis diminuta]
MAASGVAPATMENTIMLCACEENEDLPQLAELPADLFTSCLTTPIKTALRWHWMKYNKYFPGRIDEAMLDNIPGNHGNRMTLLGEINWIFTAVTDTIAWCSFPVDLFQKLFRQDLLVASLFRNYLLAERLMRAFGCHPRSWPKLVPTHDHPIWGAWDHALDLLFHYLPHVLVGTEGAISADIILYQYRQQQQNLLNELPLVLAPPPASDVPKELFELTTAKTQELIAKLTAVERQGASAREKERKKASRRDITPPPGYEEMDSSGPTTSRGRHSHGKTSGGSPRRSARFVVQKHDPATANTPEKPVEKSDQASTTVSTSTTASAQPHSAPSHLPRSGTGGHLHGHHHGQHHQQQSQHESRDDQREPEETESYASSSDDIDVDEDDLEDEEDLEDDLESEEDGDYEDHSHRSQEEVGDESPVPPNTQSTQEVPQQQQPPSNHKASMPDLPKNLAFLSTLSIRSDPNDQTGNSGSAFRSRSVVGAASVLARINQYRPAPIIGPAPLPLVQGSEVDCRPSTFFTSQMTAFALWLRTCANDSPSGSRELQAAVQLPILLQVLLSQTHRIRALQLLSEFLDLGPWAVAHCITVGILPYIVRLFHSNVLDVKPQLVFIWGKIIASAQIDFSRHEGIRESGYRYFVSCLQDAANLSPLVRTMAAFALAKMLVKGETGEPDPLFQEVYYTSKPLSFIQIAADEIGRATASAAAEVARAGHAFDHLKVWLLLALGRVWMNCDEAKWLVLRPEGRRVIDTVIIPRLNDPYPVVRASAVFALGTLIDRIGGLAERRMSSLDVDMISHQVGIHLQQCTRDPCPLVRCEVVVALRSLVEQYEQRVVEQAYTCYCAIIQRLPLAPYTPEPTFSASTTTNVSSSEHCRTLSQAAAAALLRGMAELGGRISRSRSHRDLRRTSTNGVTESFTVASSLVKNNCNVGSLDGAACGTTDDTTPKFVEDFEPTEQGSIFAQLWDMVLVLAADPHPTVMKLANIVLLHILEELLFSMM